MLAIRGVTIPARIARDRIHISRIFLYPRYRVTQSLIQAGWLAGGSLLRSDGCHPGWDHTSQDSARSHPHFADLSLSAIPRNAEPHPGGLARGSESAQIGWLPSGVGPYQPG